jgi:hypothetical protein
MATIYRKTDKGRLEIDTRAHRLPPRLRTALIMVDGQRSDAVLRQLILQQADETLATLLSHGFIEVAATTAGDSVAPAPGPTVAAQPPVAPAAAPVATLAPPPGMSFEVWRREAVRALNDTVGPPAENLALRMESAADPVSLFALLEVARQIIQSARGSAVAAAFKARFMG